MSKKYTRAYVNGRFEQWREAVGYMPGAVGLDFNSHYGGYLITEFVNGSTGERVVNGYRMGAAMLLAWMEGSLWAVAKFTAQQDNQGI